MVWLIALQGCKKADVTSTESDIQFSTQIKAVMPEQDSAVLLQTQDIGVFATRSGGGLDIANVIAEINNARFLGQDAAALRFWKAEVFNKPFLVDQEGKLGRRNRSNKGYPLRTFIDGTFINGYSDHFPVLIYLIKPK